MFTVTVGSPVVISSSGQVAGGSAMGRTYNDSGSAQKTQAETTALAGTILGFLCNSTSSGTVVLSAGTGSGGAAITGTITPVAGTWYPLPITSPTGIYATIANTLNLTFVVVQ